MEVAGIPWIADDRGQRVGAEFRAINPETGETLEPSFISATIPEVDRAVQALDQSAKQYVQLSGIERARFLRTIADGLDLAANELAERAKLETALPEARLQGEIKRTSNQFRIFAELIEEGSWVAACIDTALPERKPIPRPDLRSMLRPIGPVAVFGASNFPIAFSVAGGDTASALAAGNPVVVKAHPAHPGTSEIAAKVIRESARACGITPGVFAMLFDSGIEVGKALVRHPLVCAVAFTGSINGGRTLMDLAAARPKPIPCFAEMGSTNPVFVLPSALRERGTQIARDIFKSFTLGAGQMCTKPGLVFLPQQTEVGAFLSELRQLTSGSTSFTLLTPGIAASYRQSIQERGARGYLEATVAPSQITACSASAALVETRIEDFLRHSELGHEVFGPTSLVIHYEDPSLMMQAAESLDGQLTASVFGAAEEISEYGDLVAILERKAGRVIFNGVPTGVEVSHAMMHGGPYPATSDTRFTSVGSHAIQRFVRPVCFQGWPEYLLPEELRDSNPRKISRMVNGKITRNPVQK